MGAPGLSGGNKSASAQPLNFNEMALQPKSKFIEYQTGLLNRMWEYAKMSGVRERGGVEAPVK